jgi:hypothetical protein
MDNLKLGEIITTPQQRDAIHVAVVPVTAGETLMPGDRVKFGFGDPDIAIRSLSKGIGIVDPFLSVAVKAGERFWLFLYPGTVTSIRHDWTHPAFERRSEARATERMEAANVS